MNPRCQCAFQGHFLWAARAASLSDSASPPKWDVSIVCCQFKLKLKISTGAAPSTLCLITVGTVVLICAGLYERKTTREPLFPPTTFSDLTTGAVSFSVHRCNLLTCSSAAVSILVITFLHNFAFTAGTFYLALYYQVRQLCSSPSFTSDLNTLGCERVDAFGVGPEEFTLLPGVLPCLHACCVVHRLLAEQTSGHWRPKFGHIDRSDYLHPGIW